MAAFTVNAGGTVEWDSLSGGSVNATLDTYTISNATTLRVAVDSYQCAGHSAAFGSVDTVTFSGTGGNLLLDGRDVRVLPFDTGSGTVPAVGTSISQGGVSGPLLGIWANWLSEPLAAGAAMPASGYIKLKSVAGGVFAAGALTGIAASASGPDVVGWIEVRGADTAQITVPRYALFNAQGAWFELGVTNGSRGQVFACPTAATNPGTITGLWIETAPASGVFEHYVGVGSLPASAALPTDAVRGKLMWHVTSGLRIGSDGTNNVGYLPPAGCRVRIPNIFATCCTRTVGSGSGPRVVPSATLTTRQEFLAAASGRLVMDKACCQWNMSGLAQIYSFDIQNCAISDNFTASKVAAYSQILGTVIAPTQALSFMALQITTAYQGVLFQDNTFARYSLPTGSSLCAQYSAIYNSVFRRNKTLSLTNRAAQAVNTDYFGTLVDCLIEDCTTIGAAVRLTGCLRSTIRNPAYLDRMSGSTDNVLPHNGVEFGGNIGCSIEGFGFGVVALTPPYTALATVSGCTDCAVRGIGSAAAPLDLQNVTGIAVDGGTNNQGVKIQRVYSVGARVSTLGGQNSAYGMTVESVVGDYGDPSSAVYCDSVYKAFSGVLAGGQFSVYGTHWADCFLSTTTGVLKAFGNEPTVRSALQCQVTGGAPFFNAQGAIACVAIGDQVTLTMPYFAKGHTALANSALVTVGIATTNLSYEFQYDLGGGFNGSWLDASAANFAAVGAIDPAVGVRVMLRVTCTTANAANSVREVSFPTSTTLAGQRASVYPLDALTLTIVGLATGSRVRMTRRDTGAVLLNEAEAIGSVAISTDYAGLIDVEARKASATPFYQPWVAVADMSLGNTTITALQVRDDL